MIANQNPEDCEKIHWCYYPGATYPQHYLAASSYSIESLLLADFDGDGRTDVVRCDGEYWLISRGGTGGWEVLRTTTEPLDVDEVSVGDFDGDGHEDVFRATGTVWEMSSGGTEPFVGWSPEIRNCNFNPRFGPLTTCV